MTANYARPGGRKSISVAEAKAKVIEMIQQGFKVEQACAVVQRSVETYRDWRKNDPEFKAAIDNIRAARSQTKRTGRREVPDFDEFCRDWLKQPLHMHQYNMWDVIEGREPRFPDEAFTYEPADSPERVLINVPPDHAKSTTFTVNYSIWKIVKNPDIRIVIVSKGARLAENFLYEIKEKLTSPLYREMHIAFGPEEGFNDPAQSWTHDCIYVRGKNTDIEKGVQKDPTVQAMGLKGQIYGQRCDLIICDDIVDADNAREVEYQLRKVNRDVASRLPSEQDVQRGIASTGKLIVLGTRVAPMDIYRVLKELEDGDGRQVYTYFRMPAVLDYGDGDSSTWRTLWPERWNGPSLSRRRVDAGWNLYYQQLDIDDDMTFKAEAVNASINMLRFPGPMTPEGQGHRPEGMAGLYVAVGFDPAAAGGSAMIVAGLDRETGKRWIIDGWSKVGATAQQVIDKFQEFTEKYRPNEWVIEKNGVQRFIAQVPQLMDFARTRGVKIRQHHTQDNKFDADWGVSSMGPLFDSCVVYNEERRRWEKSGNGLIELPSTRQNKWVNDLVQQLTIWQPQGMAHKQKTDLVMALWFTHLAFMDQINRKRDIPTHLNNPFTTRASRKRQQVINLAELRAAKRLEAAG